MYQARFQEVWITIEQNGKKIYVLQGRESGPDRQYIINRINKSCCVVLKVIIVTGKNSRGREMGSMGQMTGFNFKEGVEGGYQGGGDICGKAHVREES